MLLRAGSWRCCIWNPAAARDSAIRASAAAPSPAASQRGAPPPRGSTGWGRLRRRGGAARTARRSPSIIARRSTTWPSVLCTVSSESWVRRSVSDWLKRMSDNSRLTMSIRPLSMAIGGGALSWRLLSASATRLACWRSRWRRMSCSPSSTRPRSPEPGSGGGLEPLEQIRHALFEMGEGRGVVVADRHAVDALGQRAQRAFELFGIVACSRPLAAFQRRGQRGNALLEHREGIAVAVGAGELVDLGRQRVHVLGQAAPARRWRRRWRRSSEAPRSRLRADAPSKDRHWRAGSGRAWRRDCGSRRHSRRVARRASASAALRGFRRARARCRPAPGCRCRSGGCRRCGATASGFRSRSIRSPGAASPR